MDLRTGNIIIVISVMIVNDHGNTFVIQGFGEIIEPFTGTGIHHDQRINIFFIDIIANFNKFAVNRDEIFHTAAQFPHGDQNGVGIKLLRGGHRSQRVKVKIGMSNNRFHRSSFKIIL